MGIKRIIKEYYKQLYVHKLYKLDKWVNFERHKLPKLRTGEIDKLNNLTSIKEIKD